MLSDIIAAATPAFRAPVQQKEEGSAIPDFNVSSVIACHLSKVFLPPTAPHTPKNPNRLFMSYNCFIKKVDRVPLSQYNFVNS